MMARNIFIGTLVVIFGLVSAVILLFGESPHYPIVRAQIPGGVTLTFIGQPKSRNQCETANASTASALRANCAQCVIDLAACPDKLEALWDNAMSNRAIGVYAVHSESQRILIDAPSAMAQQICDSMALQITRQGTEAGRCISPNTSL